MFKIVAIGASVLAGEELDNPQAVWPKLYADSRGLDYENLASIGCSTQYVLRTLLANLDQDPCLFILHWPNSIRFEYVNKDDDSWIQVNPYTAESAVKKIYYADINSYLGDKWNTLLMLYTAQQALTNTHHRYVMTVDDDFLYTTQYHNPSYVKFLQDQTKDCVTWFDNTTWEHWCDQQQFPRGPFKHPLEEAHQAAFEYFDSLYDTIIHKV
jgi:hypothetical protein